MVCRDDLVQLVGGRFETYRGRLLPPSFRASRSFPHFSPLHSMNRPMIFALSGPRDYESLKQTTT